MSKTLTAEHKAKITGRKRIDINLKEIKKLYIEDKLYATEIAEKYNCSSNTIIRRLKEKDVEIHRNSPTIESNNKRRNIIKEKMKSGYLPTISGWWKGKKHTEEHNNKISEAHIGMKYTEEHKRKMSEIRKGIPMSEETKRKISLANKGRIIREEWRKKISKANKGKHSSPSTEYKKGLNRGENSGNWQGGKSFEPYTIKFNKELKELIRNRDNYKCQICGMPECENIRKLDVHHIDYNKKNCLPSNLISLCRKCHIKTNFKKEYWTEYFS